MDLHIHLEAILKEQGGLATVTENQPATKKMLGKCANVNYESESNVGGSKSEFREHKHRRK